MTMSSARFLSDLDVRKTGHRTWCLLSPLLFYSAILDEVVEAPPGFHSDFASVLRIPVIFWLWGDRAHHESVIHDYLYRANAKPAVTQHTADLVFREAMIARRKSRLIYQPMYAGVRAFGWTAYHKRFVEDRL